ncbi:MAG: hypothetical protein K9M44_01825 [Candidatus Pacebacteria bacterium]|nr:hypothetical protein [Candidatus Paceibacterota bacterium]
MKKYFLIHPLFFVLIPVLALYNTNKEWLYFNELFLPLTLVLVLALLLGLFFRFFSKDWSKIALITTAFLILFSFFGYLNDIFLLIVKIFNLSHIKHLDYFLSLAFFILIVFVLFYLVFDSKKAFQNLNKYLFIFGLLVSLSFVIELGYYFYNQETVNFNGEETIYLSEQEESLNSSYPDIYYLVFDAHARSDILQQLYDYNDQEFVNFLEEKGFFVAKDSHSNYPQTHLSMSSTLNLDYLDKVLVDKIDKEESDRTMLRPFLENSRVYRILDKYNYATVSLPPSWGGIARIKSDVVVSADKSLSDFNRIFLQSTPFKILLSTSHAVDIYKSALFSALKVIPEVSAISDSTFIYAHVMSPHPPFLFDENGNIKKDFNLIGKDGNHYFKVGGTLEEYKQGYADQVQFIDKKIEQVVSDILVKYPEGTQQPIIIIQSDHGSGMQTNWESLENTNLEERLAILNAYYVPEELKNKLYDSITPVNTFRLLFNHLFDQDFELLEDKLYFATWEQPFNFINVTDSLK